MTRGCARLLANWVTSKPLGTIGNAPSGRATRVGPLSTLGVSLGLGKSAGVIRLVTPGRSVVQSPKADCPVKTSGSPATPAE